MVHAFFLKSCSPWTYNYELFTFWTKRVCVCCYMFACCLFAYFVQECAKVLKQSCEVLLLISFIHDFKFVLGDVISCCLVIVQIKFKFLLLYQSNYPLLLSCYQHKSNVYLYNWYAFLFEWKQEAGLWTVQKREFNRAFQDSHWVSSTSCTDP